MAVNKEWDANGLEAKFSPQVSRRTFLGSLTGAVGATTMLAGSDAFGAAVIELPVSPKELWAWVRAQQVLDPAVAYLDTGGFGPGLRASLAAEFRHQELFNSDPENYQRTHLSPAAITAFMRRLGALMGCDANELTLTQGATEALNIVAQGLPLKAGDEVIVTTHAHRSAIYPWILQAQKHGIVVKQVMLPSPLQSAEPLGRLAAAVTEKTRVIAIAHLQHTDGALLPVAEICAFAKQRNILSVVDGAQACGAFEISMSALGCDFYATSLHKWLNAPLGHGLLYVRKELLDTIAPSIVDSNLGLNSVNRFGQANVDEDTLRSDWPATLRKFGNSARLFGPRLKGLEAALDFREQLGSERIEARIRELAIYARLRLQPMEHIELLTPALPQMQCGVLSFRLLRGHAVQFVERLKRSERIITAAIVHPASPQAPALEAVRICLHIYNSHDDVDRLLRVMHQYAQA